MNTNLNYANDLLSDYINATINQLYKQLESIIYALPHTSPFQLRVKFNRLNCLQVDLQPFNSSKFLRIAEMVLAIGKSANGTLFLHLEHFAVHSILKQCGIGTTLLNYMKEILQNLDIFSMITVYASRSNNVYVTEEKITIGPIKQIFTRPPLKNTKLPIDFYLKNGFKILDESMNCLCYKS